MIPTLKALIGAALALTLAFTPVGGVPVKSQLIGNDSITLPDDAAPNEAAIIIGSDLPPCMQAEYASAMFFRGPLSQTGNVFTDTPVYFIGQRKNTGVVTQITDHGLLIYDPIAATCDYVVVMQYEAVNFYPDQSFRFRVGRIASMGTLGWSGSPSIDIVDSGRLNFDASGLARVANQAAYIPYGPQLLQSTAGVLPLVAADTLVAGTQATVAVVRFTDIITITGIWDFNRVAVGAATAVGKLYVDGAVYGTQTAPFNGAATVGSRGPGTQQWQVTGLAAGNHTFQLSANVVGGAGIWTLGGTNTTINVDPRH